MQQQVRQYASARSYLRPVPSIPRRGPVSSPEALIRDIAAGKMVVVIDNTDQSGEGNLVVASQFVTAKTITFMAREAGGLICMAVTEQRAEQLALSPMVQGARRLRGARLTVPFRAAEGPATALSAAGRARSVQTALREDATPKDIVFPGHLFGLVAAAGGVAERPGHAEAGCDLTRLAGLQPSATIVEILNADGSKACFAELTDFCSRLGLRLGTVTALAAYRRRWAV